MSNLQPELEQVFRASGLRATAQRYAVLEFLASTPVHATAEEIFAAINRHDPRASRATVYNSLRSLEKAGLVREVLSDGQAARFDANLHRHHHFVCDVCGEVEDVPWFEIPAAARAVLGERQVHNYEIVFRGACARCGKGAKE
ncbi:MAG: transcriptional repressor [Acidobacteria bacterium]|nr:transcriptional repressor [Acidobacteriota bacterium]